MWFCVCICAYMCAHGCKLDKGSPSGKGTPYPCPTQVQGFRNRAALAFRHTDTLESSAVQTTTYPTIANQPIAGNSYFNHLLFISASGLFLSTPLISAERKSHWPTFAKYTEVLICDSIWLTFASLWLANLSLLVQIECVLHSLSEFYNSHPFYPSHVNLPQLV